MNMSNCLSTSMNSDQQPAESVAHPRVSILVEAGAGGGAGAGASSSRTRDGGGIGRLHDSAATAGDHEGGMSPGSEMDEGSAGPGPTAIPADEGDVPRPARAATNARVHLAGLGAGFDTVTSRQSDAMNVTNDANTGEEEEIVERDEEKIQGDEELADDGSDYSYTYEDEDEGQYSGFLIPTEPFEMSNKSNNSGTGASLTGAGGVNVVASEEVVAARVGGGTPRTINRAISRVSDTGRHASPTPETNPQESERKQKWREPTRAAVNMSLRAEKEKTGGRRRLASDLYKIMMADTEEAGFSLEPSDEDSMDKWRIKLFGFDEDSNLAKDLMVCAMDHVELEMSFPDQYPFEPPFVRVVSPRFKRQTGFVMSGALCMELLTKDGWNPINDIESVIVSIRSLMVVGDGRLQAAADMGREAYKKALSEATMKKEELQECRMTENEAGAKEEDDNTKMGEAKRKRSPSSDTNEVDPKSRGSCTTKKSTGGSYTAAEAQSAYDHLSKYHKKEGWDKSGWWSRKG